MRLTHIIYLCIFALLVLLTLAGWRLATPDSVGAILRTSPRGSSNQLVGSTAGVSSNWAENDGIEFNHSIGWVSQFVRITLISYEKKYRNVCGGGGEGRGRKEGGVGGRGVRRVSSNLDDQWISYLRMHRGSNPLHCPSSRQLLVSSSGTKPSLHKYVAMEFTVWPSTKTWPFSGDINTGQKSAAYDQHNNTIVRSPVG